MMEILKDDQAKLNDFKADPDFRFDDRLNCIQIQLNYFFNDLKINMIWISNYESFSFSSIHDSYSFDPIYCCYSEGEIFTGCTSTHQSENSEAHFEPKLKSPARSTQKNLNIWLLRSSLRTIWATRNLSLSLLLLQKIN